MGKVVTELCVLMTLCWQEGRRTRPYTRRAQRFLPDWTVVPAEKSDASTL